MPKRTWASQEEVLKLALHLLESAKSGDIQGICYVAERSDGDYESGSTRTNNCFAVAGYLFSMGMRLMGFND